MNTNIRSNGSLASFKQNVFKSFLAEQKAVMLLRLYLYIRFHADSFYLLLVILSINYCISILNFAWKWYILLL